ncbi:MAG: hypothetical protein CL942_09220 [Desulfovibrio sp.]|nr:hypothetical protein [Desulfovibrio sp.]
MSIYEVKLKHDQNGRIVEKIESIKGKPAKWLYSYDKKGRLFEAHLNNRLVCQCCYDKQGRRSQDCFPRSHGSQIRSYSYRMDNRLMQAGNNGYTHDKQGFRSIWNRQGKYTLYEYATDYRLIKATKEDEGIAFEFTHDENGQRQAKYHNGAFIEGYKWLDFIRMEGFHDGETAYRFVYDGEERTPYAMQRENGAIAYLYYDQVGSLRVAADESGNVIKEVLYDPFGGIIEDSNPELRIPIGFAGGLHDRDLGFVRFGWRDYDTFTSRWTAPDPMGDAGGDPDWYGYCLDDPVNRTDALGLYAPLVNLAASGLAATGLLVHAPKLNKLGIGLANELMGTSYGFKDLAVDSRIFDDYTDYVANNVARLKKQNKAYHDRLTKEKKEKKANQEREMSEARARDRKRQSRKAVEAAARAMNKGGSNDGRAASGDMSNFRDIAASYSAGKATRERSGYGNSGGHSGRSGPSGNIGARGGSYNGYGR